MEFALQTPARCAGKGTSSIGFCFKTPCLGKNPACPQHGAPHLKSTNTIFYSKLINNERCATNAVFALVGSSGQRLAQHINADAGVEVEVKQARLAEPIPVTA
jgi:hypothetical protein